MSKPGLFRSLKEFFRELRSFGHPVGLLYDLLLHDLPAASIPSPMPIFGQVRQVLIYPSAGARQLEAAGQGSAERARPGAIHLDCRTHTYVILAGLYHTLL